MAMVDLAKKAYMNVLLIYPNRKEAKAALARRRKK